MHAADSLSTSEVDSPCINAVSCREWPFVGVVIVKSREQIGGGCIWSYMWRATQRDVVFITANI